MADSAPTNLAAELFVASQLFRVGLSATITFGNTKQIDLIAIRPDSSTLTIDVKALKNTTNWVVTPKRIAASHFFVFVCYRNRFQDPAFLPEAFVIPSLDIRSILKTWAGRPEVSCVAYRDVRESKYRNAWELLTIGGTGSA